VIPTGAVELEIRRLENKTKKKVIIRERYRLAIAISLSNIFGQLSPTRKQQHHPAEISSQPGGQCDTLSIFSAHSTVSPYWDAHREDELPRL